MGLHPVRFSKRIDPVATMMATRHGESIVTKRQDRMVGKTRLLGLVDLVDGYRPKHIGHVERNVCTSQSVTGPNACSSYDTKYTLKHHSHSSWWKSYMKGREVHLFRFHR